MNYRGAGFFLLIVLTVPTLGISGDPIPPAESLEGAFPKQDHYSPYAGRNFPTEVFWGDTHVHTAMSMDAGAFGARLVPTDAYRFARGEELTSSTGQRVKLSRPLDFLVVADHSDNMGFFPKLFAGDPEMLADPTGKRWYDMVQEGGNKGVEAAVEIIVAFSQGTFPETLASLPGSDAYSDAWEETIEAAETYNDPGRFTAFIGYEWTSNTGGNNLHRVVILRDGAQKASTIEPYTTLKPLGSDNPRDLWDWLQAYEDKTGGRALAIGHNGNLSNGIMFPLIESFTGRPVDLEYATTRSRWEPLYEATQIKGDGEAHPFLSPTDEFADYETWDQGNLDLSVLKEDVMLEFEYARSALQLGLQIEQKLGVNPYDFGMIGSTDTHTALSTAEEENFFGKHSGAEPSPKRMSHPMARLGDVEYSGWSMTASGYAADVGYTKGVPMGGDLSVPTGKAKAPNFLVAALKDPYSGNLDRIQIVKGWVDSAGENHEKIYDVVWSGDRSPDGETGKLPPVGNTVDVASATWTNTIGSSELITVWEDPDFDPDHPAAYYARVLEIPTPRWTAYEAARYGLKVSKEIPMTTQERAYTSPIWYTP